MRTDRRAALAAALSLLATTLTAATAVGTEPDGAVRTVTGEVQRLVVDTFDGSDVELDLVVADDEVVRVGGDELHQVPVGAVAEVTFVDTGVEDAVTDPDGGVEALAVAVVAEPEAPVAIAEGAVAEAATTRTVHVGTGTFPGQSADGVTPAALAGDVTSQVAGYWSESTDGAVLLGLGTQRTFGTYAWNATTGCTGEQILAVLRWAGGQVGVVPDGGAHAMLYTPRLAACGFAGVAHVADGGIGWINGPSGSTPRWQVFAHELGHTLDLGHSQSRFACPTGADGATGCQKGDYGDAYDVMGLQLGQAGLVGAAHLDGMGLSGSIRTATASTKVTLLPVGGRTGTRALKFTTGTAAYYVELRSKVGRDSDLGSRLGCPDGVRSCSVGSVVEPGVVVHRVDTQAPSRDSYLLRADPGGGSAMEVGDRFTTADGAWTVTVDALSTQQATVSLTSAAAEEPTAVGAVYRPVSPSRVLPATQVGPKGTVKVRIPGVPAGATAVALNVTATSVRQTSYVSTCAGGTSVSACSTTSALNPSAGVDTAAHTVVALGGAAGDEVVLYNNAGTLRLIADLQGFYVPDPAGVGGELVARTPSRALQRTFAPGEKVTLTLPDVPQGATAVALNVTSTRSSAVSFVSVCPNGQSATECRATSVLNPTPGRDIANAAVVRLGGTEKNQVTVYNNRGTGVVNVDVTGWFVDSAVAPSTAGRYHPITPRRVLNRVPIGPERSLTTTVGVVPSTATAIAATLTAPASSTAVSYVSACAGGVTVSVCRTSSAFNPRPGVDTSNAAIVSLGGAGGRDVLLYNNRGTTPIILDVRGYYRPEG
ncbi:hypothetical protein Q9R32_11830 [Actinotalea sp. AC32]|nr:hypothetical protein [Actinotalea sp. AC32]